MDGWVRWRFSFWHGRRLWMKICGGHPGNFSQQKPLKIGQMPKGKAKVFQASILNRGYCWWFKNPKQPPGLYKTLKTNGINDPSTATTSGKSWDLWSFWKWLVPAPIFPTKGQDANFQPWLKVCSAKKKNGDKKLKLPSQNWPGPKRKCLPTLHFAGENWLF